MHVWPGNVSSFSSGTYHFPSSTLVILVSCSLFLKGIMYETWLLVSALRSKWKPFSFWYISFCTLFTDVPILGQGPARTAECFSFCNSMDIFSHFFRLIVGFLYRFTLVLLHDLLCKFGLLVFISTMVEFVPCFIIHAKSIYVVSTSHATTGSLLKSYFEIWYVALLCWQLIWNRILSAKKSD